VEKLPEKEEKEEEMNIKQRLQFWLLNWIELSEVLLSILTFTYSRPWWSWKIITGITKRMIKKEEIQQEKDKRKILKEIEEWTR